MMQTTYKYDCTPSFACFAYKFTGKERDTESGNDYFDARYYSSMVGRFMSPDWSEVPSPIPYGDLADPQSLNLYAYGGNNPLNKADKDGHEATVTVTTDPNKKTGTITITASIAVYAANGSISAAQVQAAAGQIQSSINSAWSGSYSQNGIDYTVTTSVSVSVVGSQQAGLDSGAQNVIGLQNGNATGTGDSVVNWASSPFSHQDTGTWNVQSLGAGVDNHEFTHLLGVEDRTSGAVLSNTNILNDPSVPRHATSSDFGWAVGGAVSSNQRKASIMSHFSATPSTSTTTVGAHYFSWAWQ
jgi:RHS repeat-associated protein